MVARKIDVDLDINRINVAASTKKQMKMGIAMYVAFSVVDMILDRIMNVNPRRY